MCRFEDAQMCQTWYLDVCILTAAVCIWHALPNADMALKDKDQ